MKQDMIVIKDEEAIWWKCNLIGLFETSTIIYNSRFDMLLNTEILSRNWLKEQRGLHI